MIIAIDTSTETASLALVKDGEVLAESTWRCGQSHTTQLLLQLSQLLKQTGQDLKAATGVVVARGPGSFNGLRVGVSTAKGFAFSLNIPIIGIGTLEVEAYQHAETGLPICAMHNAGRGEIAAAIYQKKGNKWQCPLPEHLTTVQSLSAQIATKTIFCGELTPDMISTIRKAFPRKAIIPSSAARLRRAGYLAELGLKRFKAGDCDNPATLQPIYLRRPPITTPKKNLVIGGIHGELARP